MNKSYIHLLLIKIANSPCRNGTDATGYESVSLQSRNILSIKIEDYTTGDAYSRKMVALSTFVPFNLYTSKFLKQFHQESVYMA